MKNCSNVNCKQNNPQQLSNFAIKKTSKDGHRSRCKSCTNEEERLKPKTSIAREKSRLRTAKYRKLHPEKILEQKEQRKSDPKHKEKARLATAKYRLKHPEKALASLEKSKKDPYYKEKRRLSLLKYRTKDPIAYRKKQNKINSIPENREKRRKSSRESAKRNPAMGAARSMKRYAAKLNRTPSWLNEVHLEEMIKIYKECSKFQLIFNPIDPLQVDHIIPIQGENISGLHVPWNLQILPRSLNVKKANKILEKESDLYKECEEFKESYKQFLQKQKPLF